MELTNYKEILNSSNGVTMKADTITTEWSYSQDEDSGGRSKCDAQFFTIKTCDNGIGNYMVIETERWAMGDDDIEPFVKEIRKKHKQIKSGKHTL